MDDKDNPDWWRTWPKPVPLERQRAARLATGLAMMEQSGNDTAARIIAGREKPKD